MITNSTIGITGANGFIGSALTKHLTGKGYSVIPFVRDVSGIKIKTARRFDLTEENFSNNLFQGVDILIHCAFVTKDQHADAERINFTGTKHLIESCRQQGVKKIIFISSITAGENAKSAYAKSKFAIHKLLDNQTDLIIQCSLVIGEGGLFFRLLKYALTHTFIPLVGSGQQIIQLVAIDDANAFISDAISSGLTGSWVLANNERVTYKQLFATIAEVYRTRILFIQVPVIVLKVVLKACTILNIRTPVSGENILGLQALQIHDRLASLPSPLTLKEKLEDMRKAQIHSLAKITR